METLRLILSAALIACSMFFFLSAAFGVNRFRHALNRIHAAALADTLGMLFLAAGLVIRRGFCFTSAKLLAIVFFFWIASPVASHMIGQLEIETDNDLGELKQIDLNPDSNPGEEMVTDMSPVKKEEE